MGKSAISILILAFIGLTGCEEGGQTMPGPGAPLKSSCVMKECASGPVVVCFPGPETLDPAAPPLGLALAAVRATAGRQCSLAFFGSTEDSIASIWMKSQANLRGQQAEFIIIGHGYGGAVAGDLARQSIHWRTGWRVRLLVTVDAVISQAKGAAASLTTLDRAIPGRALLAYTSPPPADGRNLVRHVNYYENDSQLYHGVFIKSASENHLISRETSDEVRHSLADDICAPLVSADIRAAFAPLPMLPLESAAAPAKTTSPRGKP